MNRINCRTRIEQIITNYTNIINKIISAHSSLFVFIHVTRFNTIALSLLLVFTLSSLIKAHHELLPAPEREYLKLISLHPFKDKLISLRCSRAECPVSPQGIGAQGNYDFFITIVESAPDTFDIIFYIENSLFKRAVRSSKEILLYRSDTKITDKFILESDISGVSSLKYFAHKPFETSIKVSAKTSDNEPISVKTDIQIGSPPPSIIFIVTFILIILIAIISVYLPQKGKLNIEHEHCSLRIMNILNNVFIYRLFKSRFFIFLLKLPFVLIFIFIIFSGLFGSVYKNISNFIVGPVWLLFISILALLGGKFWCLICPWNTLSDWLQGACFSGDSNSLNLKVPKILRNYWIAIFLFILIIWLEYSIGMTDKARLIAYLAMITFGITFIWAIFFHRKSFCRYGCPVGAICGLYGLFAPLELRSNNKDICNNCKTKDCITERQRSPDPIGKGNQKGIGCPVYEYPATIKNNLYCIYCTECIKTCPNDNIAINLRLPAKDMFKQNPLHLSEVFIIITILALSVFGALNISSIHFNILDWSRAAFNASESITQLLLMTCLIIAFTVLFFLLSFIARLNVNIIAYAFLPVALFNHIANTFKLMNMRGQEIISLISDPFGLSWNLFGTAGYVPKPIIGPGSGNWSDRLISNPTAINPLILILAPIMIIGLLYSAFLTYRLIKNNNKPAMFFLLFIIPMIIIVWFNWWLMDK
ncbi:MAG: 4Fe-4S binding protein [Planctomycetota bacterium]